jgi:hypothetical protein
MWTFWDSIEGVHSASQIRPLHRRRIDPASVDRPQQRTQTFDQLRDRLVVNRPALTAHGDALNDAAMVLSSKAATMIVFRFAAVGIVSSEKVGMVICH